MSFNDFWAGLEAKNPQLRPDNKMKISVEELKRLLRRAYDSGRADEKDSESMFDRIFGRFRGFGSTHN